VTVSAFLARGAIAIGNLNSAIGSAVKRLRVDRPVYVALVKQAKTACVYVSGFQVLFRKSLPQRASLLCCVRTVYGLFDPTERRDAPLFQRPYVWKQDPNWEPLWQSIKALAEIRLLGAQVHPHFLRTWCSISCERQYIPTTVRVRWVKPLRSGGFLRIGAQYVFWSKTFPWPANEKPGVRY